MSTTTRNIQSIGPPSEMCKISLYTNLDLPILLL